MSPPASGGRSDEMPSEFERRAQALLEESVTRIDGRVRSRLNQARHAAVEASLGRFSFWRRFTLMPAAGAVAAAALVAFVLWPHAHQHQGDALVASLGASGHATVEDLDLLADGEALDLVSEETDGGAFLEWAAEQTDSNETSG